MLGNNFYCSFLRRAAKRWLIGCFIVTSTVAIATTARSENNILFILDASNSMWGQINSTAKITTAKNVLDQALANLPKGINPALMIYGHRQKDDCGDVELAEPFGQATVSSIRKAISAVSPRGKTPIADSLQAAISAFSGREEENNSILLISDGIETCEGDPCAVAAQLIEQGMNVRVNVVGFDVDATARTQLQCIADKGNGEYFDVKNAKEFQAAIEETKVAAVQPEPIPLEPLLYFEDLFDGSGLDEIWEIVNPDPDKYLVENDVLIMLSNDGVPATEGAASNVLRLGKALPKGDWTVTMRVIFEPQTMGEIIRLGIGKDAKNMLATSLSLRNYNYSLTNIDVSAEKLSKGKSTSFTRTIFSLKNRDLVVRAQQFTDKILAVELRLQKEGRNYTSALRLEPTDPAAENAVSTEWLTVQQLTSLRPPGNAFIVIFGSNSNDYTPKGGEGVVRVDWLKVEIPNKG